VTELQGSVTDLTLTITSINVSSSLVALEISADLTEFIVTRLEPDTVYSAVLTLTVHGGQNISSDPATVRTASGGQAAAVCHLPLVIWFPLLVVTISRKKLLHF